MKKESILYSVILLLMGIGLWVASYTYYNRFTHLTSKYEKTLGRISDKKSSKKTPEKVYPVVLFVTLDSQKVHFQAKNEKASSYEVGDVVEIYYDIINPTDAHIAKNELFYTFLLGILGCISFGGASWVWSVEYRKIKKRNYLLKYGKKIQAEVQSIGRNPQMQFHGEAAYIIYCQYTTPEGQLVMFQSEPLAQNPANKISEKSPIYVFVERTHYQNYYVDVSFLS